MILSIIRNSAAVGLLVWIGWAAFHSGAGSCESCSTCSVETICVKK